MERPCDLNVIINERDPEKFLAKFFCALKEGRDIWLTSPSWGVERMERATEIARKAGKSVCAGKSGGEKSYVFIPTGGTTGRMRFAAHTEKTLVASARGFLKFFGCEKNHRTFCALPLYHVSGLMQVVRAMVSGGRCYFGDPADPSGKKISPDFTPEGCFISLVPTQLKRLVAGGQSEWLKRFEAVVVGGAALDPALANLAREKRIPLAPSYGMTETAAAVCAMRPNEFIAGKTGSGRAMPHAEISIESAERGVEISKNRPGIVVVRATSVCEGYADENGFTPLKGAIRTQDLGWIDTDGILHVDGRADCVIVCGGEKIDPLEIEEILVGSRMAADVAVIGLPDPEWGKIAIAYYVPGEKFTGEEAMTKAIEAKLSRRHVPKIWKKLASIPRTEAGKLDISGPDVFVS